MDHKEFVSRVQQRSGLDKQQCAMLLNCFERIIQDEALNMVDVEIDNFGKFESHKHPEYIQENNETGEVVLYPPRITCRFRSDFKLD